MNNSNEKLKCCAGCSIQIEDDKPCVPCEHCPCHKPSVEVSKCVCGKRVAEPYSSIVCSNYPNCTPNLTPESTEMEEWAERFDSFYFIESDGEWNKEMGIPSPEKIKEFISNLLSSHSKKLVSEYKQFILNILDGIDKADEEMGNKGGGTKAIRLAIESRII